MEVRKSGRKLEVLLSSGNLFFDVARPLEDDESLNIRTSTMAIGIRGTSGWVQVVDRWKTRVSILEGTVECSVADPVTGQLKAEKVSGGETVLCVVYPQDKTGDKCDILREKFAVKDIPGFVMTELRGNKALCDKIKKATGMDVLQAPAAAPKPSEGDSDHDSGETAETKPAPKPEAKPDPKPEAKPDPKPETKPTPTPTPKPTPTPTPTPTPDPEPEVKPDPTPETKPETDTKTDSTPGSSNKDHEIADGGVQGVKRPQTGSTSTSGTDSASTPGSSNKSSEIAGSTGHGRPGRTSQS